MNLKNEFIRELLTRTGVIPPTSDIETSFFDEGVTKEFHTLCCKLYEKTYENKSLYDLDLHETTMVMGLEVMRVPGGWKYSNVFVPFSAEFNAKIANKKAPKPKFTPPTIEEVKAYCKERNNNVDAVKWFNFYNAKGWKIGKEKMTKWKSAVITWEEPKNKSENEQQKRLSNW